MGSIKGVYGGVLLVIGGIWLLGMIPRAWYVEYRARDWRETPAIVLESRAEWTFSGGKDRGRRSYRVELKYRFDTPQGSFEGDRYDTHGLRMSREEADAEVARLAPGTRITVFYDPDEPMMSAMIRTKPANGHWLLSFGLLFLCVGIWQTHRSLASSPGDRLI